MSTPLQSGRWTPLPRARLAPTGSRVGGPARIAAIVGGLALAVSAGVLVFVAVRPLPSAEAAESVSTPPTVELRAHASDFDRRSELLGELGAENLFAFKRGAWTKGETAPALNPDGTPVNPAAPMVAVDPGTDVPADIKPALDNLRLVGLFDLAGKPGMLVSYVTGDDPAKAFAYRVGDEFTDKAHPTPAWKVVAVEPKFKRAVLSRGGRQVELKMFRNVALAAVPQPAAGKTDAPKPPPVVVSQTRDEVIAKLREAKVSEAEIALLLAAIDKDAPAKPGGQLEPTGAATAEAIAKALGEPGAKAAESPAPPAGLEEVLRMMAKGRAPGSAAPEKSTPPAPPPAPPADPPTQTPKPQ